MNLKPLDEYVAYDQTQQAQSDVDADIVFVGYGIEAPEYGWDDYKGVDVRGKVLLMLVNEPPSDDPKFFKGKALTYYGRWTYKYEEAARKGAVGVILVHQTQMASYPWEVVRNSNSGEKSFLKLEGPALKVASWVQLDVATRLASASGMNLEKMMQDAQTREFHPVNLGAKLRAHMVSKVRNFESNNVVAMLPGSDHKMADEAVMYTAHYDHFGIRPDMPGTTFSTAPTTTPRDAASCWSWRGLLGRRRRGRGGRFYLRRSRRRSRGCWGRSIWGSIRRFRRERLRWI